MKCYSASIDVDEAFIHIGFPKIVVFVATADAVTDITHKWLGTRLSCRVKQLHLCGECRYD